MRKTLYLFILFYLVFPTIHGVTIIVQNLNNSSTIEIYIPRDEIMSFFTMESGRGSENRAIGYIAYSFLSCSLNEPVRRNPVSTTKQI